MAEKQSRMIWRVHETTARGLCRLTFVLLGIVPLGLCLLWCAQQFLPSYQNQQIRVWEQLLSSKLGMRVKIAAFEARAPQRFALHEVRLTHLETGEPLGEVRLVEVRRAVGKWNIQLTKPRLNADKAQLTWRLVHDWLLCRPQSSADAALVEMDELAIYDTRSASSLHQVTVTLLPTEVATFASSKFFSDPKLGALARSQPTQLIVKRHHRQSELRTEMQLRTGSNPLPCSLAGRFISEFAWLGESARFSGTVNVEMREQAWRAVMTEGKFENIDLSRLSGGSAIAVSGIGQIELKPLVINQSGLELAYGSGVVSSGKMPQRLFQAFGKHFGVQLRPTNPVTFYAFDTFGFSLHVSEPKLHFCCNMSDALGLLALRDQEKWTEALSLDRIVSALSDCSNQSTSADIGGTANLPASWLAKQALVWLPLGKEHPAASAEALRLSSNQTPSGNE